MLEDRSAGDRIIRSTTDLTLKGVEWIDLAQDKDRFCEYGDQLLGSVKCEECFDSMRNY